jgi:hypothetical protein
MNVLFAGFKIYLADAAIVPAVLGVATETAAN